MANKIMLHISNLEGAMKEFWIFEATTYVCRMIENMDTNISKNILVCMKITCVEITFVEITCNAFTALARFICAKTFTSLVPKTQLKYKGNKNEMYKQIQKKSLYHS